MESEYLNKKIHIKDIINKTIINGKKCEMYKSGNIIETMCPSCKGKDHLKINDSGGYAKCYSCGWYAADALDYYMKVNNLTMTQAYEKLKEIFKISNNYHIPIVYDSKYKEEVIKETLNPEILDKIYNIFSNISEITGEEKLSQFDKEYLLSRFLTEDELRKYGFFSCPSRSIMPMFIDKLKKENIFEYLKITPGFNYDMFLNQWTFIYYPSIMIPMKNEYLQTIAIQKRNHFVEKNKKYSWFSSLYYNDEKSQIEKGYCYGASSGSPLSIFYPEFLDIKNILLGNKIYEYKEGKEFKIAITEGAFKAITLSKLGYIVISMQGVYSAKSNDIDRIITNISNILKSNIKNLDIYFDTDMKTNLRVLKAVRKLCEDISVKYNINIATWDENIGKGIDDYINNKGEFSDVEFIHYNKFVLISDEFEYTIKYKNINNKNTKELKIIFKIISDKYD